MSDRTLPRGDRHDFDFLFGDWTVKSRRLRVRWTQSDDWHEFLGTSTCRPQLGGLGNVEEVSFPTEGFSGMAVRLFNTETRRWAIYWADSRGGALFPPVHGGFSGEHGVFFGKDEDEGRPVHVRFFWSRLKGGAARWQQAFSRDGLIWETNWIMDFKPVAPAA